MPRKKIVAATMIAAALGLAFAGYSATRANGTEGMPRPARPLHPQADAGYRQNHQIGHDGAVFEWMDAAASLNQPSNLLTSHEEPVVGKDLISGKDDEEIEPVAVEHASRVGTSGWEGYGLASGGGGGTPKGADDWGGGRYASNFGSFNFGGGIGSFGGGGSVNTKGASGSNDTAGDKPHQDAPSTSNDGTGDKPGTADPKAGDPPANLNPPSQEEQHPNPPGNGGDHTPGGPKEEHPNPPGHPHDVPEPATLGLLGFGLMAAAALRRRRRN